MPAACALIAISVSALPSKGRMTSESTFLSISVWTWLICWLTSLLPSTACRVTSLCFAAWPLALVVMAAIQPWSAAGAEKPMVTALPGVSLPLGAAAAAEDVVVDDAALLLVHAVRAAPAPRAPAPRSRPRRPSRGESEEGDMVDLFRGRGEAATSCSGTCVRSASFPAGGERRRAHTRRGGRGGVR